MVGIPLLGEKPLGVLISGSAMEQIIRLSPHPASARAAREFVAQTLLGWGRAEQTEAAVLLTSELVTNAVIHAGTRVVVTLRLAGGSLRIAVLDESAERPHRRHEPNHLGGGRGLMLVEALAASWGVSVEGPGKSVWFELA